MPVIAGLALVASLRMVLPAGIATDLGMEMDTMAAMLAALCLTPLIGGLPR